MCLTQRPHSVAGISPRGAGGVQGHSGPGGWCPRWPPGCRAGSRRRRPWPPTPSLQTALHRPADRRPGNCTHTHTSCNSLSVTAHHNHQICLSLLSRSPAAWKHNLAPETRTKQKARARSRGRSSSLAAPTAETAADSFPVRYTHSY